MRPVIQYTKFVSVMFTQKTDHIVTNNTMIINHSIKWQLKPVS